MHPEHARVRRRILATYELSAMERDFIKVAAKRAFGPVLPRQAGAPFLDGGEGKMPTRDVSDLAQRAREEALGDRMDLSSEPMGSTVEEAAAYALSLAATVDRQGPRYASSRPVGCLLLDRDGQVIHQARNTNRQNRSLHAEVNLCQTWFARNERPFPSGCHIVTTLQPCRMCASMLLIERWFFLPDTPSL